jgi:ribosomal protein S18 acetylase RimI-like enzyme
MAIDLSLRPALPQDFAFCRRVYFDTMGWIILELGLKEAAERARFRRQWRVEQVRIAANAGEDVGWLQTAPGADAIFLAQLYVDTPFQRQGIGGALLRILIAEANRDRKALSLGVVKINPARRLYARLGFRVTREDRYKLDMRREADPAPA